MTDAVFGTASPAGLVHTDAGSGQPVLFVHGLISDHRTWAAEVQALARTHRVIAPDLFGHGDSIEPVAAGAEGGPHKFDYSLGGHAGALRDLLDWLEIPKVTVVGHSLGGGIAMQLAYLFPDRVEALVLVSSGGLGQDLNPALRAATLPGSEWVLSLLGSGWARRFGDTALGLMGRVGLPWVTASTEAAWSGMATFADPDNRKAFLASSRSVIDLRGQTVSALHRLPQLADRPMLVVWGGRDRLIPASHADVVRHLLPDSVVEIFPRAGHFPHLDEPDRFHRVLTEFLDTVPSNARVAGRSTKSRKPRSARQPLVAPLTP